MTVREGEIEPEYKEGGGQVCAISAGTVCTVPDWGDMAVARINKQSAAPEHHDQSHFSARLGSVPGSYS